MANYPYLNDKNFLKKLDLEPYKKQFVRILVLDFKKESVIASIEGKATSGTCNLSGTSSMRRTASCSLVVDPNGILYAGQTSPKTYANITDVQNLISINKKVRIEVGFTNTLAELGDEYYPSCDVIWFPLGVYVIKTANISKNNSGINISLTLNDKTALLNGDMGGTIPAGTVFSESEEYNLAGTERETKKLLIKDIIRKVLVEFGGEDPNNIIITDIDDHILKVMKWIGKTPLYFITEEGDKRYALTKPENIKRYETYNYGQDIGYINAEFIYPGTLECNAGETVATILDKIKNTLGNFEWFYDINGKFIFREIKNYLYTAASGNFLNAQEADYLSIANDTISVYEFTKENGSLLSSISSSPQYKDIKNDFIVWGTTKTVTGADKPIHYHLAFDKKPTLSTNPYLCLVYKDYRKLQQVLVLKEGENFEVWKSGTVFSDPDMYYLKVEAPTSQGELGTVKVIHWDDEKKMYRVFTDCTVCFIQPIDWRVELYLQGLSANKQTFTQNPYAAELNAEWPKLWNALGGKKSTPKEWQYGDSASETISLNVYNGAMWQDLDKSNYVYWLDFLEGSEGGDQSLSQFNVNNIGRRTKVVTENSTNCIFPVPVPNYILIEADGDTQEEIELANEKGQEVIQVSSEIYQKLSLGGGQNDAYTKVKELLAQHTQYNESITLSTIPIYYLEPNLRITVFDNTTGTHGDYLIKSMSLPLAVNGTGNITATKTVTRSQDRQDSATSVLGKCILGIMRLGQ